MELDRLVGMERRAARRGRPSRNCQEAPYPHELEDLVSSVEYRPGWRFSLEHVDRGRGSVGLTLVIFVRGYDTYHPERGETYEGWHYFPVPPMVYNRESWARWILDRLIEVETHEACEFLKVDGRRPFAPKHDVSWDLFSVRSEWPG